MERCGQGHRGGWDKGQIKGQTRAKELVLSQTCQGQTLDRCQARGHAAGNQAPAEDSDGDEPGPSRIQKATRATRAGNTSWREAGLWLSPGAVGGQKAAEQERTVIQETQEERGAQGVGTPTVSLQCWPGHRQGFSNSRSHVA